MTENNFTPMFETLCNLCRFKNSNLVAIGSICLSLCAIAPAMAEYKKPPSTTNDAPNSQATTVAATRGICSQFQNNSEEKANLGNLTALAPYNHVGYSASANPTFTWYVPDSEPYLVEFTIYEFDNFQYQNMGKPIYQKSLNNSSGIMTHSLPTEGVNLISGKTYVWQVAVICNRSRPSENIVVSNQIKIVESDPKITTQLSSSMDSIAKADIYAEVGLWYDALAEVATRQNDPQAQDFTVKLISQLAAIEQEGDSDLDVKKTKTQAQNLEQVIEALTAKSNQ